MIEIIYLTIAIITIASSLFLFNYMKKGKDKDLCITPIGEIDLDKMMFIQEKLKRLCNTYNIDRINIYQFHTENVLNESPLNKRYSITYEYARNGIKSIIQEEKNRFVSMHPETFSTLSKGNILIVESGKCNSYLEGRLKDMGVLQMIIFPIISKSSFIGTIAYYIINEPIEIAEEFVKELGEKNKNIIKNL